MSANCFCAADCIIGKHTNCSINNNCFGALFLQNSKLFIFKYFNFNKLFILLNLLKGLSAINCSFYVTMLLYRTVVLGQTVD